MNDIDIEAAVELMPGFEGARRNGGEIECRCWWCGKKKYSINRYTGLSHCWNSNCEAGQRGFNIYQLYAATNTMNGHVLNDREARAELRERLNMGSSEITYNATPRIVYKQPEAEPLANPDARDKAYNAFLDELQLNEKNKLDLRSRGFNDYTIESRKFRTFPRRDEVDYFALCRRIQSKGISLKGVPGFFRCKNGAYCFIQVTKGIIMPIRDFEGRIVGLQIRKDDELRVANDDGKLEAKCAWFSSKNCSGGCGAASVVHFAHDQIWDTNKNMFVPDMSKMSEPAYILTEGMMKAELIHQFCPNLNVIAVAGVDNLKYLPAALKILKENGVKTIKLAYDMDYETNENVYAAMERTKSIINSSGLELWKSKKTGKDHIVWNTDVVVKGANGKESKLSLLKGLDDYLAYMKLRIIPHVVSLESQKE